MGEKRLVGVPRWRNWWAQTPQVVRHYDANHRSVVPTGGLCGISGDLANEFFQRFFHGPSAGGFCGLNLWVAWRAGRCHNAFVKRTVLGFAGVFAVLSLPLSTADNGTTADPVAKGGIPAVAKTEGGGTDKAAVPLDLRDSHVLEELGVNEFTAPSIASLFDTLQFLMPIPMADMERKMSARMPLDRADLAIELGFLIADGFLVVQAGQMEKVEDLAKDLTRYGKALGAGDRVNQHSASLLDSAKKGNVEQLKTELRATQKEVEDELVALKDPDLAQLISLGGWIRALEVAAAAVDKQFSTERARKIMREDIADYYTESVAGLEPRISERPNYLEMRDILSGLRNEMVIEDGKEPIKQQIAGIRKQAGNLVKLALQRQQ